MLQIIYSEEMMIKINNLTKKYKEKYPLVQFGIHTGTADNISEMMNKGF